MRVLNDEQTLKADLWMHCDRSDSQFLILLFNTATDKISVGENLPSYWWGSVWEASNKLCDVYIQIQYNFKPAVRRFNVNQYRRCVHI